MKFCPECGSNIENKDMCNCGYEVSTGKVNKKVREELEKKNKSYNATKDNIYGDIFIDEMYKGDNVIFRINSIITSYINGMYKPNIEEDIYNIYKTSPQYKELIENKLEIIKKLEIDKHINNALEKIKNE